ESADEFDALRDAFEEEIKPQGIIEKIYLDEFAYLNWEILRLRRCKVVIVNAAFRDALEQLVMQLLRQPGQHEDEVQLDAQDLAHEWFTDDEAKGQVSELLSRFQLDQSAIEAEAIRMSSSDLEVLDRMLSSSESRRDEALRYVAAYRATLAR